MSLAVKLLVIALGLCVVVGAAQQDPGKKRILVVCTGNSARSQMAAGFLSSFDPRLDVYSAGTDPAPRINPNAIRAMNEVGIDISHQTSKDVELYVNRKFDFVITVCDRAKQQCPIFPGAEAIHWGFDDPAEAPSERQGETFRRVREEILQRIRLFLLANSR